MAENVTREGLHDPLKDGSHFQVSSPNPNRRASI
jgi:hypothetical protein